MVSTYHSADTQRFSNKGMKQRSLCAWLIIIIAWGGVNLKDQLLHKYMFKWSRAKNEHMVPPSFQNAIELYSSQFDFIYWQVTGRNIQQLSYRIQLVEGLFTKYACAVEMWSVPGRKASENTVPRLTERHFLRKVAPKIEKSKPQRKCVVCSKHGKEKTPKQCTAAKYVMWDFSWKIAFSCITRSSITEVMIIILLHLYRIKISLLKFFKNRIINLRILFLNRWFQFGHREFQTSLSVEKVGI